MGQHSPLRGAWTTGSSAPIPVVRRVTIGLMRSSRSEPDGGGIDNARRVDGGEPSPVMTAPLDPILGEGAFLVRSYGLVVRALKITG